MFLNIIQNLSLNDIVILSWALTLKGPEKDAQSPSVHPSHAMCSYISSFIQRWFYAGPITNQLDRQNIGLVGPADRQKWDGFTFSASLYKFIKIPKRVQREILVLHLTRFGIRFPQCFSRWFSFDYFYACRKIVTRLHPTKTVGPGPTNIPPDRQFLKLVGPADRQLNCRLFYIIK